MLSDLRNEGQTRACVTQAQNYAALCLQETFPPSQLGPQTTTRAREPLPAFPVLTRLPPGGHL